MRSRSIKKLLLSLIVVGVIGSFTAGGTFAVLNGEGSNPNSQLASGTLLMQNSVFGGAQQPCASQTVSLNVNTGCDALFTSGNLYPIPSAAEPPLPATTTYVYADMTIKNAGTLPGTVSIYMPSCVASTTTGAPSFSWSAINPCCPGGAYPCTDGLKGSLDLFIQEYSTGLAPPSGSRHGDERLHLADLGLGGLHVRGRLPRRLQLAAPRQHPLPLARHDRGRSQPIFQDRRRRADRRRQRASGPDRDLRHLLAHAVGRREGS